MHEEFLKLLLSLQIDLAFSPLIQQLIKYSQGHVIWVKFNLKAKKYTQFKFRSGKLVKNSLSKLKE